MNNNIDDYSDISEKDKEWAWSKVQKFSQERRETMYLILLEQIREKKDKEAFELGQLVLYAPIRMFRWAVVIIISTTLTFCVWQTLSNLIGD